MALEVHVSAVRRSIGAAVVLATLGLGTPAFASGPVATHGHGVPSARSAHRAQTYRGAMAAIDATFARSVAIATRSLHIRMAHAKSAADRIDARNRYRTAIVKATQLREQEVVQLDQSPLGKDSPDQPVTVTTDAGSSDN